MKQLRLRKTKTVATTGRHRQLNDRQPVATAFSYHSRRAERLDAPNRQQPTSSRPPGIAVVVFWRRRLGFLIGSIIILVCVVNILMLSTSPRLEVIDTGNTGNYFTRSQATYQQAASRVLASSLWNRNKITVNTASVASQLMRQFPELSSASVTLPLIGHRPIVYVQISQPAFIFNASNGSYVLDASGKALALSANVATAKLHLPEVTDQTGLRARLGSGVLTSADTTFIRTVLAELAARQVAVGAVDLPAGAADELDIHLSNQNYYVKFNMHAGSGDAREQAGAFLATQARLKSENITPSRYIDVRVDGRAYYQ